MLGTSNDLIKMSADHSNIIKKSFETGPVQNDSQLNPCLESQGSNIYS
jgi:hypothetical protein